MKITEQQIAAAYQISSQIYFGQITKTNGIESLSSEYGLNKASANDFIYNYNQLVEGKIFHRTLSASAVSYFIEQISIEHGVEGLTNALTSLRAHIDYYESLRNFTMQKIRNIVEHFESLPNEPKNLSDIEKSFDIAVAKSLQEPKSTRLKRLSNAKKTPLEITVQHTVFIRNPDVVAEALHRAAGFCEQCKCKAPFIRAKDGTPYLEVHHKVQLANGGEDSLENAIAVCPNCHRKAHYGATDTAIT